MLTRNEALALLRAHVKNEGLIKHMVAVGAIMRGLAQRFGEDPAFWEAVGILHDVDYEEFGEEFSRHGALSAEIVKDVLPEAGVHAIRAHNPLTGSTPTSRFDVSLYAADALSGLVIAMGLMMPDKKLASVKASSLVKRMKDKSFARNVSRENIQRCSEIGLTLDEFLALGLASMVENSSELDP
jgi:putative nucleotidyltransferase with HDIG domain